MDSKKKKERSAIPSPGKPTITCVAVRDIYINYVLSRRNESVVLELAVLVVSTTSTSDWFPVCE